ncbi:hypothetical protein [Paracoccus sp. (in: a-proteobacteria)]|uniref:hypothetical protein n=1 Tax=Paracoccus sp. TaxID=267 RepID=UPI0035B4D21A
MSEMVQWDHFRTTEQSNGASSNRRDEELRVDKEMAGFQPEFFEENREMFDRIKGHWDDWNWSDSIVSDEDVHKYAVDSNRGDAEREAARFLLDNKRLFDMLDTRTWDNGKDGKVSNNDLNAWLDEVRACGRGSDLQKYPSIRAWHQFRAVVPSTRDGCFTLKQREHGLHKLPLQSSEHGSEMSTTPIRR